MVRDLSQCLKCAISSTAHTLALAHLHSASSLTLAHTHTTHKIRHAASTGSPPRATPLPPSRHTLSTRGRNKRARAAWSPFARSPHTHTHNTKKFIQQPAHSTATCKGGETRQNSDADRRIGRRTRVLPNSPILTVPDDTACRLGALRRSDDRLQLASKMSRLAGGGRVGGVKGQN